VMGAKPRIHDPKHAPQRTTGGLLAYIGILAAGLLAMSYPVATASVVILTGFLILRGRRVIPTVTARTSASSRHSRRTTVGEKSGLSPRGE